ncbi:hypothetical protein CRYUN_Cryun01aG0197300 [Craigia yunnanensis]
MKIRDASLCFLILVYFSSASANSVHGCGGFVEVNSTFVSCLSCHDCIWYTILAASVFPHIYIYIYIFVLNLSHA